jgi:hypothetical protein
MQSGRSNSFRANPTQVAGLELQPKSGEKTMPTATLEATNSKIREFMSSEHRLLIDEKWVAAQSGETFSVYNPASGEVMRLCAAGDKADIDLAVKAARRAFEEGPWSRLTHLRKSLLKVE